MSADITVLAANHARHMRRATDSKHPFALAFDVMRAISSRLSERTLPHVLLRALPDFNAAAMVDAKRGALDVSDYLQTLVAIGAICAKHRTEFFGDDVSGRHCLGCEFGMEAAR